MITITEASEYDVLGSWWAGFIFWKWGQELAGSWFARKAKKKYARYERSIRSAEKEADNARLNGA